MRGRGSLRFRAALLAALATAGLAAAGCGGSRAVTPGIPDAVSADLLVAHADTALATGEVDAARRLLERAMAEAPESSFVHVAWGRLQTALRRYRDAKEAFDRAAALAPASGDPAYWLGRAYQQAGDENAAAGAYETALRVEPGHRGASEALAPILEGRYEAAGIPREYARLRERPTISRGELAVVFAVELGADPDRSVWRSDARDRGDLDALREAWGGRWVRAAAERDWLRPFADGSYRLEDPVTRAALALLVVEAERRWRADAAPADSTAPRAFPDLGSRHYLARAASEAVALGLPPRGDDGRFDPWAAASGDDALRVARGLARRLGVSPVVSAEPR